MRKNIVSLLTGVLILVGIVATPLFADDAALTNFEMAELLVTTVGINLPQGSDQLADAEYYDTVANLLAARGITYFKDNPMTGSITAANFASILYQMLGQTGATDPQAMLSALIANGSMTQIDPGAAVSKTYALQALQNPLLKQLEAEKYQAPAGADDVQNRLGAIGAPDTNPDTAVSTN